MTHRSRVSALLGLCAAAIVLGLTAHSHAMGPWTWGGPQYAYYAYPWGCLGRAGDRDIPYFAAHPPVYYSHIVARPYGYSPYAYLPGIVTPGFELTMPPYWDGEQWQGRQSPEQIVVPPSEPEPKANPAVAQTVRNPFFSDADDAPSRVSGKALRIRNPFVETSSGPQADAVSRR